MSEKPNTAWLNTMVKTYGSREAVNEFMKQIGSKGGKKGTTGGFYSKSNEAREAGKLGGHRSKRGYKLIKKEDSVYTYENRTDGSLLTINWGEKYDYGQ